MKRVFLSYNSERDRLFASRLQQHLRESSRFEVVDAATGDSTSDQASQIRSQIQRASMLIAILHTASSNVLLETGIALGAGKQVLIVGGEPESIPLSLRSLPYILTLGETEADLGTVLRRLDSLQLEEEHPRPTFHTAIQQLRTYINDPAYFESMPPGEFEQLIIHLFEEQGFKSNTIGDPTEFGVDFVARSPVDQSTIVMEAKKFSRQGRVSMRDVMALLGAATLFKASTAVLITSSSFTRAALEMAADSRDPRLCLLTMEDVLGSKNLVELVH